MQVGGCKPPHTLLTVSFELYRLVMITLWKIEWHYTALPGNTASQG